MKNLVLLFTILTFGFQVLGQSPHKPISPEDISALKSLIEPGADLSYVFGLSESLLKGDYPRNAQGREDRKQKLAQELEANPEDPELLRKYGTYYEGEEAINYYRKAFEALDKKIGNGEPSDKDFCTAGQIMLAAQNYPQAYEYYEKALEQNPQNAEALSQMAMFSFLQQNFEQSRLAARKALEVDLSNVDAHIFFVQSFIMQRITVLSKVKEEGGDIASVPREQLPEVDFSYAEKASQQFAQEPHYAVMAQGLKLLDVFYRVMLGLVSSVEAENADETDFNKVFQPSTQDKELLEQMAVFFQQSYDKSDPLFIDYALATIYVLKGENEAAEAKAQKLLEQDQLTENYYYNLAFLRAIQQKWEAAAEVIKAKIAFNASPADYNILTLLYDKQGKTDLAYQESKKLAELAQENPEYAETVSVMAFKKGDYEAAKSYFTKMNSESDNLLLMQAVMALENKEWLQAYQKLQKASVEGNEEAARFLKTYFDEK